MDDADTTVIIGTMDFMRHKWRRDLSLIDSSAFSYERFKLTLLIDSILLVLLVKLLRP